MNSVFCVQIGKLALFLCVSKKLEEEVTLLVKVTTFIFPGSSPKNLYAGSHLVCVTKVGMTLKLLFFANHLTLRL